ncbi:MAG: hypothetical protein U1D70_12805 [Methylobacter sp.]|nr:hypothetical protein [Methylobacter sp.]MDP2429933.1 hypothetical protein [Methylobacter sp.]MDP3362862.1 hypothetical protein [Methylobacter sp.]MDZ4219886.1 hypothetical protein [Methylobacter sp.]
MGITFKRRIVASLYKDYISISIDRHAEKLLEANSIRRFIDQCRDLLRIHIDDPCDIVPPIGYIEIVCAITLVIDETVGLAKFGDREAAIHIATRQLFAHINVVISDRVIVKVLVDSIDDTIGGIAHE